MISGIRKLWISAHMRFSLAFSRRSQKAHRALFVAVFDQDLKEIGVPCEFVLLIKSTSLFVFIYLRAFFICIQGEFFFFFKFEVLQIRIIRFHFLSWQYK